jgi:hypothetical protein
MTKTAYFPSVNTIDHRREQIRREWLPAEAARRKELAGKKQQGLINLLRMNGTASHDALGATSAA